MPFVLGVFSAWVFEKFYFQPALLVFLIMKLPVTNPSVYTYYRSKRFQEKTVNSKVYSAFGVFQHGLLVNFAPYSPAKMLMIFWRHHRKSTTEKYDVFAFLAVPIRVFRQKKSIFDRFYSFSSCWLPEGTQVALASVKIPAFLCSNLLTLNENPACTCF